MTTCPAALINSGCTCLSNPVAPESQVCAYINRQSGLVAPCESGCCVPACTTDPDAPNILQIQNELRPSAGTALPPSFGVNLATSTEPTPTKGASEFRAEVAPSQTVWERIQVPLFMLVIVLLAVLSMA